MVFCIILFFQKRVNQSMRLIIFLILGSAICVGGWYLWENSSEFRTLVEENTSPKEFKTLSARFTADTLMQAHKNELIKAAGSNFLEPKLVFHPYLLMKIKYLTAQNNTNEGTLLFGLNDGEMVLDTKNWEKTHGFSDCIQAKATPEDFNILRVVIENGGQLSIDDIYQTLKIEPKIVDKWIDSCRQKKLLVSTGNMLRLHVAQPKFSNTPLTRLDEDLVTMTTKDQEKTKRTYSAAEIQKFVVTAFGETVALKSIEEVYLPVYSLTVQNGDGSLLNTSWNALTGKRIN